MAAIVFDKIRVRGRRVIGFDDEDEEDGPLGGRAPGAGRRDDDGDEKDGDEEEGDGCWMPTGLAHPGAPPSGAPNGLAPLRVTSLDDAVLEGTGQPLDREALRERASKNH